MHRSITLTCAALSTAALVSTSVFGGYLVEQGPSAPTYTDYALDFDEPGGPTGMVPPDAWLGTHNLIIDSGVGGGGEVAAFGDLLGWDLGDENSWKGPYGGFMTFQEDLTGMSLEVWDPSGPEEPWGGGMSVYLFNDGIEVAFNFFDAPWGGEGDTWLNLVADGGDVFDEVRILGWGMIPETYMDNMSWDVVPSPGGLAIMALAGLAARGRRRH
jgi:hypothetical protein